MKQNLLTLLALDMTMDVDLIDEAKFLATQGDEELSFTYPSTNAKKIDDRTIGLVWTQDDTWKFEPKKIVRIDTEITLKDSEYQPEAETIYITIHDTKFEKVVETE